MSNELVRKSYRVSKRTADAMEDLFDGNYKDQALFVSYLVEQAVTKIMKQRTVTVPIQVDIARLK